MSVVLIDGDIVLYKVSCTNESKIDWGDGVSSKTLDLDSAKESLDSSIKGLVERTKAKSSIVCLSHKRNFRYTVLPTYKHNRQNVDKPDLYYDLQKYLIDNFETRVKEWLEADDVMGIIGSGNPKKYIIATLDKDLKQIPGRHFNWNHDTKVRTVTLKEANTYFYTQVLTGDSTDGYSGCPGIGPKKAAKILEGLSSEEEIWETIKEQYALKGLSEDDALQQARVARILRTGEYWEGKPILWQPNSQ